MSSEKLSNLAAIAKRFSSIDEILRRLNGDFVSRCASRNSDLADSLPDSTSSDSESDSLIEDSGGGSIYSDTETDEESEEFNEGQQKKSTDREWDQLKNAIDNLENLLGWVEKDEGIFSKIKRKVIEKWHGITIKPPPVELHEINFILISQLRQLQTLYAAVADINDRRQIVEIIKAIVEGTPLDVSRMESRDKIKLARNALRINLDTLKSDQAKDGVKKIIETTNKQYTNYNLKLQNGFRDILDEYIEYIDGDLIYAGDGYQGEYQEYDNFIQLVHRLSLMDGDYVKEIKNEFEQLCGEGDGFDYQAQCTLLDKINNIFISIQTRHYEELQKQNDDLIQRLHDAYYPANGSKPDQALNALQEYFYQIIDESDQESAEEEVALKAKRTTLAAYYPDLIARITHDIDVLKNEVLSRKNMIDHQLKCLKKEISHLSEELGIRKQIARDNENPKFCKPPYKKDDQAHPVRGYFINRDKQHKRYIKKQNKRWAFGLALIVGLSEGIVAAVGLSILLPITVTLLVSGLAGLYCNFYFIKDDTTDVLDKFRLGKIFRDKNDKEISRPKKGLIIFCIILAASTGFVYSALAFFAVNSALIQLGIGAVIALGCAVLPVIPTAIGLSSIAFVVMADFIKNQRWKSIKNYFKRRYHDPFWEALKVSKWKTAKHIGRCAFEILKLLIGLSVSIFVTVASMGVFHQKGIELLSKITSWDGIDKISWVPTSINAFTSFIFGVRKVSHQSEDITLRSAVAFVPKLIVGSIVLSVVCSIPTLVLIIINPVPKLLSGVSKFFFGKNRFSRWIDARMAKINKPLQSWNSAGLNLYNKCSKGIDRFFNFIGVPGATIADLEKGKDSKSVEQTIGQKSGVVQKPTGTPKADLGKDLKSAVVQKPKKELNQLQKYHQEVEIPFQHATANLSLLVDSPGQGLMMTTAPGVIEGCAQIAGNVSGTIDVCDQAITGVSVTIFSASGDRAAIQAAITAGTTTALTDSDQKSEASRASKPQDSDRHKLQKQANKCSFFKRFPSRDQTEEQGSRRFTLSTEKGAVQMPRSSLLGKHQ